MINGYEVLKDKYLDFDDEQRQPNGIDLRLGNVYSFKNNHRVYGITNSGKNIPPHVKIDPEDIPVHGGFIQGWALQPHKPYILEVENQIKIDDDCAQMYYPRSTLLRCACTLHTAVGDAGYTGKLAFLFINHSDNLFIMEKGVRFAQLVDHQVLNAGIQYDGDYQDDKHKED